MQRMRRLSMLAVVATLPLAACSDDPTTPAPDPEAVAVAALAAAGVPVAGFQGHHVGGPMLVGMMSGPVSGGMFYTGRRPGEMVSLTCAWSDATQRMACDPVTFDGITLTRAWVFLTADGTPQQFVTAETEAMRDWTTVEGTFTRPGDQVTFARASERTMHGFGLAATALVHDGVDEGTSSGVHQTPRGVVRSELQFADTVTGLTMPRSDPGTPRLTGLLPTAGRMVRTATFTVQLEGEAPRTHTLREVATFSGGTTLTVEITRDGVTRTCQRDLVARRETCR